LFKQIFFLSYQSFYLITKICKYGIAIQTVEARQQARCQGTNSFYDKRLTKDGSFQKYFGDSGEGMTIR